ncbi:MAG: DUF4124 domain-containing protein [Gammaproteobacteria bacterium]|jgi:hypothetical protein
MNPFYPSLVPGRRLQAAALFVTTLLLQSTVYAEIYKWADDSGEIHYTQTPPPTGIASQVIEGAPPPSESPETIRQEQQKLQQRLDAMEERRAERENQKALERQRRKLDDISEKNCITAKNNLAKLHQGGIKRYLTPEGEVIRLTEEERVRRITEAQNQVDKYCSQ